MPRDYVMAAEPAIFTHTVMPIGAPAPMIDPGAKPEIEEDDDDDVAGDGDSDQPAPQPAPPATEPEGPTEVVEEDSVAVSEEVVPVSPQH